MPIPFSEPSEIQPRSASQAMQFDGTNLAAIQAWADSWSPEDPPVTLPTIATSGWLLRTWDNKPYTLDNTLFAALFRLEADYASTPEPDLGFLG